MRLPFTKEKKKKEDTDYLSLTLKEKVRSILFFLLKWGLPIFVFETLIWVILEIAVGGFFFETSVLMTMGGYFYSSGLVGFNGGAIIENTLLYLPAASLIIGGCMGGLSRYNIPPKLRIIEPDDQAVTPVDFQIRIRYDDKRVDPKSISVQINEKVIPSKISEEDSVVFVSGIFKTPPKKAVSLSLTTNAIDEKGKEIKDKIRVICDPDADEEDYLDYWEFKREDETFWGKEMIAANKHAKRSLNSIKLIVIAVVLMLFSYILSLVIRAIST